MGGSIRKRGKNSWELTIDLGREANGKRLRKFVSVKGKKADAERKLREILTQLDKGIPIEIGHEKFTDFITRWLKSRSDSLAPQTLRGYEGNVRLHLIPNLGHMNVTQLQVGHVQEMLQSLLDQGLSGTTVVQVHRILHKALEDAVKWGVAWRNVADAVTPPKKNRREMQVLNADQLTKLLAAADEEGYGALFTVSAHTGLRRSELLGLQWKDIDLTHGSLSVQRSLHHIPKQGYVITEPKSARGRRTIALGPALINELRRHRAMQAEQRLVAGSVWQSSEWVFTRPDGRPLDPAIVSRRFSKLVLKLELPKVRLHDLRHTHATLLLAEGVHPKIVQERLGHSSISITLDTYSHVLPGLQEQAAVAFESALAGARSAQG